MKKKIRLALIYKKSYNYFDPNHFDRTTYDFFMVALQRNPRLEISYYSADYSFDTEKLKGKTDVILLTNNRTDGTPDELRNIHTLELPVISRTGDPHHAKKFNQEKFHDEWKIDYYFGAIPKNYFYKFYPKNFKFKEIIFGLESQKYENLKPFEDRIKNKILNSGVVGKNTIKSRVANAILNPKRSGWYFYKLRTMCNELEFVDHKGMRGKQHVFKDYPTYLSQYQAAIAATTFYPTQKYWEIPAAGCLTFMEITEKNNGKFLGFRDGINSIFINEDNYKIKFQEYLHDSDNSKWSEIAEAGRNYVIENLTNDHAINSLLEIIDELI
tara:strand:- start:2616 stop:3596 length:981 start_codon:yes stop_codon:yes gene_type:complete